MLVTLNKKQLFFLVSLFLCLGSIEGVEIKVGEVGWRFDSERGGLTGISYNGGNNVVMFSPQQLWMFISSNDTASPVGVQDADEFKFTAVDGRWRFEWRKNQEADNGNEPSEWKVRVDWSRADDCTICGEITAEGVGEEYDMLLFPIIAGVPQGKIVVPYWMGEIFDPQAFPEQSGFFSGSRAWEYPGTLSMQWFGVVLPEDVCVMLWAMDGDQHLKKAELTGNKDSISLRWLHYLPLNTREEHIHLPYKLCLSIVIGGWFEMSQEYKKWAWTQSWVKDSRKRRGVVPEWALNTAVWVWNRSTSDRVLLPAIHLKEQINLPVSVLWHWWHNCAYDVGFPEYLPPREGMESFSSAIEGACKSGVYAIVYVNQRLWGMNTRSWSEREADRYAVRRKSGEIIREVYNPFVNAPCVPMCMGTEFWRKTLLEVMLPLLDKTSIAGFYLDQACATLPCFAVDHGHPPGAGDYWLRGFRELVGELRKAGSERSKVTSDDCSVEISLAGEGCSEAWLPLLDLFLSLQVSKGRYAGSDGWRPIPLFQAVYHPVAIQFGNYASLTEPPYDPLWGEKFMPSEDLKLLDERWRLQFRYEQACAWAWGQQMCIANYKPELWQLRKRDMKFFNDLLVLRNKYPKYFRDGVMLNHCPKHIRMSGMNYVYQCMLVGKREGKNLRKEVVYWFLCLGEH